MGSPITLSGFNDIDFNAVLEAVMTQESVPLQNLQTQQKSLESKASTFRTLAAKLATFESAVADLKDDQSMLGRTASSTDDTGRHGQRRQHRRARHLRCRGAGARPRAGHCFHDDDPRRRHHRRRDGRHADHRRRCR